MKSKIILVIGMVLLVFGFSTNTHPYDFIACGFGGFIFGWGLVQE